nr:unnamed protein product [Digitaria exilis]
MAQGQIGHVGRDSRPSDRPDGRPAFSRGTHVGPTWDPRNVLAGPTKDANATPTNFFYTRAKAQQESPAFQESLVRVRVRVI